jgi:DNA polymerase-3 subunit gamma/tau
MTPAQIQQHLDELLQQENIETDPQALMLLAHAADGSMRDALSLLDQAIAYGGGAVKSEAVETMLGAISRDYLIRIIEALIEQDANKLMQETRTLLERNPDYQRVCSDFIDIFHQMALYLSKAAIQPADGLMQQEIMQCADRLSSEEVQLYYQIVLQGRHDLELSPDQAVGFEMLMLRLLAFSPSKDYPAETPAPEKKSL